MLSTAAMENISIVRKLRALAADINTTAWNINGFTVAVLEDCHKTNSLV
jgi:hypothetical protein